MPEGRVVEELVGVIDPPAPDAPPGAPLQGRLVPADPKAWPRSWALECGDCRTRLVNETPGERPPLRCPQCGSPDLHPVHGDYDSAEELQQNVNIQAVCTGISQAIIAEIQVHGSDPAKYMFTVARLLDAAERLTGMANVRAADEGRVDGLGGFGGYGARPARRGRGRQLGPLNGGVIQVEPDGDLADVVNAFDNRYVRQAPARPVRFQQNVLDFVTAAKQAADLFEDPTAKATLREQVTAVLAVAHGALINEGQAPKALPEGGQEP